MKLRNKSAIVATVAAGLLVLSGCAAGGEMEEAEEMDTTADETTEESTEAADSSAADLSGISITVGSKQFQEQLILGYMLVEAFEAAGADVTDQVNLGGTSVARNALVSGEIDTYMEYNGTGWATHLGNSDPSFDPAELTEAVRAQDLEENGIVWLGRSPFNNTYAFTSSPELTEENGGPFTLTTMMEYVTENPDSIVCMEEEYPNRDDGLVLLEEHTGLAIPEAQREIMDFGLIYTETGNNNCDFGEVYTTDGRIPALGLTLVEDPGVHLLYNVSVNIREEVYSQAPEVFDELAEAILSPLDNDRMAALQGRVSVDGDDAQVVARDYLVAEGIISE